MKIQCTQIFLRTIGLCIIAAFMNGCGSKKTPFERKKIFLPNPTTTTAASKQNHVIPTVTIWIHGTQLTTHPMLRKMFHASHELIKATDFDPHYHLCSIARALAQADPLNYPFEHIYFFGWTGALDFKERRHAAGILHQKLKALVAQYQKIYGTHPKIRIITHSHGGNVALNLARIHDSNSFIIDELILLACPVQTKTEHFIESSIFKEVFAIYSSLDVIQVADPQGLYSQKEKRPLFSRRRFEQTPNVMQVKIKVDGHALLHSDFICARYIRLLPGIVEQMRTWHKAHGAEIFTNPESDQLLCVYTDTENSESV